MPVSTILRSLALWLGCALAITGPLAAGPCEEAAQRASDHFGVPLDILLALAKVESGRRTETGVAPWPWTINLAGKGYHFDTKPEAEAFAQSWIDQGQTLMDIGCFQINLRWHSQQFSSLDQMFDPFENAAYAAIYLSQLMAELGDWGAAIGAYHSRNPEFADPYRDRVAKAMAEPAPAAPSSGPSDEVLIADDSPRQPGLTYFPLFQGGAALSAGSLMTQSVPGRRLIGG